MIVQFHTTKGGLGLTTMVASIASVLAETNKVTVVVQDRRALNDMAAVCGYPTPMDNHFRIDDVGFIIHADAGHCFHPSYEPIVLVEQLDHLVGTVNIGLTANCYLALRRAVSFGVPIDRWVCRYDERRVLREPDVENVLGVTPIYLPPDYDVCRGVDAGLAYVRIPSRYRELITDIIDPIKEKV